MCLVEWHVMRRPVPLCTERPAPLPRGSQWSVLVHRPVIVVADQLLTLLLVIGRFVAGGPLRVLLGDQALQPLRQLAVPVVAQVRPGVGEVEVALVLERLGGGTVGDPVLLEL